MTSGVVAVALSLVEAVVTFVIDGDVPAMRPAIVVVCVSTFAGSCWGWSLPLATLETGNFGAKSSDVGLGGG